MKNNVYLKLMLNLKLTSFLIFLSFLGIGQQFHFKNYALKEGLTRTGVYYILQDHTGFIWVGTDGGGVCKFDGFKFYTYTRENGLPSEHVRVIFEDKNNVLWFGTDKGLAFFDGGKFVSLTTDDGLSDNFIRSITQDKSGNLWVGTNRGISIIDPSEKEVNSKLKFNFNLPHKKIRSVLADSNQIWIGTDAGLCLYQNGNIKIYTEEDGLASDLILTLFIDAKKKLWVGTQEGLSKLTGDSFQSWTHEDGLINNRVRSINEDIYNNIWIGTKKGISRFDGKHFLNIGVENGLSNERIRCIQTDNFDNIWLGTYFGGIMRFNYKDFIAYTPKIGLISNQILAIHEDDKGDIIIGSFDGVSKLKINEEKLIGLKHITTAEGLVSQTVKTIYKDKNGFYWYGTDKGISIINDKTAYQLSKENGLKFEDVNVISFIDNQFYIGTTEGLAILKLKQSNNYSNFELKFLTKEDGLSGSNVSFIKEDHLGRIWVGFTDGQLTIMFNNQLINPRLPIDINEFTALAFDDNQVAWLGTNGRGLYFGKFDANKNEILLNQLSQKNKLTSNYVFSLLNHQNKIWVGHEKGLDVVNFTKDSLINVEFYGVESGFLGLQNNKNAAYADSKGNLWFGTVNGLYCLRANTLKLFENGKPSISYIKSVLVNKQNIDWTTSVYAKGIQGAFNLPVDLALPYDVNSISFDFVSLNFIAPQNVKYSWRLKGFDDWCALTSKSYCDYTSLDPGVYTFELKTTNEKGELTNTITQFEFKIRSPFWNTWWFKIFAIVVIICIIMLVLNLRTKQLLINQKRLESTIADRTQEIMTQKDKIEDSKKEIEKQHAELSNKNKEITDSIVYSRRIQRSILPSREKVQSLLKNYFIFYKPKDIVSGDFYWLEQAPNNKDKVYFAVADCTGHGVPGAMVSLVCTRALESALLEYRLTTPSEILEKTNQIVTESFTDRETGKIINDGMDVALGSLDYTDQESIVFNFSGAQNSAWIVTKLSDDNIIVNGEEVQPNIVSETKKLFVIDATKQPIGHFEKRQEFKSNQCQLQKGQIIYLYTDGFADQFGGEVSKSEFLEGKKYKYKPLKKFILSIQHLPIQAQKEALNKEFLAWKNELDQIDDVCILGLMV